MHRSYVHRLVRFLSGLLVASMLFAAAWLFVSSLLLMAGCQRTPEYPDTSDLPQYMVASTALAKQGEQKAQFYLGLTYEDGKLVTKNIDKAIAWYTLAADQGNTDAMFNLGRIYSKGIGVPKDDRQAFRWYEKAAARGDQGAQYNLANAYADGRGVAKDEARAIMLYRKLAEDEQDQSQTKARAQTNLAFMYCQGLGVKQDVTECAKWYKMAADHGSPGAQYSIGFQYMDGEGVAKDNRQAYIYLSLKALVRTRNQRTAKTTPLQTHQTRTRRSRAIHR